MNDYIKAFIPFLRSGDRVLIKAEGMIISWETIEENEGTYTYQDEAGTWIIGHHNIGRIIPNNCDEYEAQAVNRLAAEVGRVLPEDEIGLWPQALHRLSQHMFLLDRVDSIELFPQEIRGIAIRIAIEFHQGVIDAWTEHEALLGQSVTSSQRYGRAVSTQRELDAVAMLRRKLLVPVGGGQQP
ncbi:hypothetical protein CCC_02287 [Paramagnetospirillum magnetotacticum MS-1]|uniref:Uncharacterized protein n=1 Tax=Paramagnetospirillum magnetotacticum MS-1 TaxID=272627 RepID=A0A0C2UBG5_PARME|nr:hypothetical protein [Paramagnetospirillum magnetotacticum]KIL98837.1 hypothetical protein CCC_02287 [Paramagnetospirillum magnetotacticum MS-1]